MCVHGCSETIIKGTKYLKFMFLMNAWLCRLGGPARSSSMWILEILIDSSDKVCASFSLLLRLRLFGEEGILSCDAILRFSLLSLFRRLFSFSHSDLSMLTFLLWYECKAQFYVTLSSSRAVKSASVPVWWAVVLIPFTNRHLLKFFQDASWKTPRLA